MSICVICKIEVRGGLHTDGDGYNDGRHVDFDPGPFQFYCWKCHKQAPDHNAKITRRFREQGMCGFLEAWIGRCQNSAPCAKHNSQLCWCGVLATRNCDVAGTFVCGYPMCDNHQCKIHGDE